MDYYFYFINIDNVYVKFGITKNLFDRLTTHRDLFVKKLVLKDKLEVIKILKIKNEHINRECERSLKNFLKYYNNDIKKYKNTEIFLLKNFEYYYKKIINNNKNFIDTYNCDNNNNNNYCELSNEEFFEIFCEKDIIYKNKYVDLQRDFQEFNIKENDVQIEKNIETKINIESDEDDNSKRIKEIIKNIKLYYCFRCGNNFTRKNSLKIHLSKKNICPIKYLKLERDDIYELYDKYLIKFIQCRDNLIEEKFKCEFCEKKFGYKKNLQYHIKNHCKTKNLLLCKLEIEKECRREYQEKMINKMEQLRKKYNNIQIEANTDNIEE